MASPVRTALYGALTSDAGMARLLATPTSVFHQVAPLDTPFPYVLLSKMAGNPSWAFAGEPLANEVWMVKAVCSGSSASRAEDVAAAVDRVLTDAPLTLDGKRLLYIRRQSDVEYAEQGEGADLFHHVGANYRVVTQAT